jgi:hypothetical protein
LTGRIAAELAAPQGKPYRFIAGLAGEIGMRRWRKMRPDASIGANLGIGASRRDGRPYRNVDPCCSPRFRFDPSNEFGDRRPQSVDRIDRRSASARPNTTGLLDLRFEWLVEDRLITLSALRFVLISGAGPKQLIGC